MVIYMAAVIAERDPVGRLNPFHSEYDTLQTSRSREDCAQLLSERAALHGDRTLFYICTRPLAGWAAADGFALSRCVPYKNTYRTWAQGKLVDGEGGTLISCRTAVHHLALAGALLILALWIALLTFLPLPVLWTIFFLWLGSVILRLYVARGDRRFLLQFLQTALDARPAPASRPAAGSSRMVDARQLYQMLPGHHVPAWSRVLTVVLAALIVGRLALVVVAMLKYG